MDATMKHTCLSGRLGRLFAAVLVACVIFAALPSEAAAQTTCEDCTASVMNQITAAYATMGYWAQSDMIHQLRDTDFGLWAPLLYIMAVFSGLLMMAMGQPPRLYIWFILGPAIYNWLLFTPAERKGVAWMVANNPQDMKEVWKLSEVGMNNLNQVKRLGGQVKDEKEPGTKADVAMVFAWFDDVVSSQVQFFIGWTGLYSQEDGTKNTHTRPGNADDKAWSILSNSKWPMLENITSAALGNSDLRESFVHFFASECGDILAEYMVKPNFIAASHARGFKLPEYVLPKEGSDGRNSMYVELNSTIIPAPTALLSLLKQPVSSGGGLGLKSNFTNFNSELTNFSQQSGPQKMKNIRCDAFLWTLVQGFRWEAGHAYNQIVSEGAGFDITPEEVVFSFVYGWKFGKDGQSLDEGKQRNFIIDLVLVHIFRNELAIAPSPVAVRYSSAEKSVNYTEAYQRNIGSKNKYGELYTWAKMMPFVQGILLYILSIAFPLCCVVIVIPGWYKALFTWMGFFAWAKSWDAGFAIVMSLERSIWAMVGNTADAAIVNERILDMQDIGTIKVECPAGGTGTPGRGSLNCEVPEVTDTNSGGQTIDQALNTLDQGMLMAAHLDLDLSNSYYIYIMSALYFAVPAVTGQVLLGAKAGAAGMVSTMVGGVAQETGKAAGTGFSGDAATKQQNAFASGLQANRMKSLRESGLAMGAIQAGNRGLSADMRGSQMATAGQLFGMHHEAAQMGQRETEATTGLANAAQTSFFQTAGKMAGAGPGGTGAGTGANGGIRQWGSTIAGRTGQAAFKAIGDMPGLAAAARNREAMLAANQVGMDGIVGRAQMAMGQFETGAMSRGYQLSGQRFAQAADAQAQEAGWRFARNYSEQITGRNTAFGVFAGKFDAGQKQMGADGMAAMGQLGSDTQGAFWWAGGGYQRQVGQAKRKLSGFASQGAFNLSYGYSGGVGGSDFVSEMGQGYRAIGQVQSPNIANRSPIRAAGTTPGNMPSFLRGR